MEPERPAELARLTAEVAEAERSERLRLAEALHDDALQRLFVARQDLAEIATASSDRRLASLDDQLGELTASLRALVTATHDESLETASLQEALRHIADDATRRGRVDIAVHVDPQALNQHDAFVLEVVRELLANVVKHAHASRAWVEVTAADDALSLHVRDDGLGVDPARIEAAGHDGHLGHARLRRRVAALEGSIAISSPPGGGTHVHVSVPVDALRAQRALEDELRRERGWSAALVAAMDDGFLVFREGRVVQVNDRFCALTGWTREAVLADPTAPRAWPTEEREALLGHVLDARRAGHLQQEAELRLHDGGVLGVLVSGRGIRDGAGRHAGMLVTVRDITELRQAAARREREVAVETAFSAMQDLRSLVEAAVDVRGQEGVDSLLDAIGAVITEQLGWGVVINLHRPAWDDFEVRAAYGVSPAAQATLDGQTYGWGDWTMLQERFLRRGAYVIPADALREHLAAGAGTWWTPEARPTADLGDEAWLPEDALFVPVKQPDGQWLGILSLDEPRSGRRPTDAELDVVTTAASILGIALQRAREAAEAAGHRAALEQLLRVSSRIAGARALEPVRDKVVAAIVDVLGFERVLVDEIDPDDGLLRVRAGAGLDPLAWPATAVAPEELGGAFDIGFRVEGCYLLSAHDVAERVPAARAGLPPGVHHGRGPLAWEGHRLVVPLYGPEHELIGVLWVDEPRDRLLPSAGTLQALRAFANQASAVFVSAWSQARLLADRGSGIGDGSPLGTSGELRRELARESQLAQSADSSAEVVLWRLEGLERLGRGERERVLVGLERDFRRELRASDRAFRVGEDLFALLLPGAAGDQAAAVVDRLRARAQSLDAGLDVRTGSARVDAGSGTTDDVLALARRELDAAAQLPG